MKDYFKYNEIKEYFDDFIVENSEALKDSDFRDDLHHHAFNTLYYIIGTYSAKEWLGNKAFDVIEHIREYEDRMRIRMQQEAMNMMGNPSNIDLMSYEEPLRYAMPSYIESQKHPKYR